MVLNGVGLVDVYFPKHYPYLLDIELSDSVQHLGEALHVD